MGVMECNRRDCENILCNRYNDRFGYICDECFEELVNGILPIDVFMNSSKVGLSYRSNDRRKELEQIFR